MNDVNREMAQLRMDVVRLRAQLETLGELVTASKDQAAAGALADARRKAETTSPKRQIGRKSLADRFNEEPTSSWADSGRLAIERVVHDWAQPGSEVRAVACHSSVCRLEVEHSNPETASKFLAQFPTRVMGSFASMVIERQESEGGGAVTLMYLAKPNGALEQELGDWQSKSALAGR